MKMCTLNSHFEMNYILLTFSLCLLIEGFIVKYILNLSLYGYVAGFVSNASLFQ